MRVVALISGGKDSCYNMMQCVKHGHVIVALANLKPSNGADELDSFMYQTVGHNAIDLYAQAMDLPLYRGLIHGSSVAQGKVYTETDQDEVEDLYKLLKRIKDDITFDAVSVGAILSDYQRVRVENVCSRLGLSSLAYLWRRDQQELLSEMISSGIEAVLVKVAAMDLNPHQHLGLSISEVYPLMCKLNCKYGSNVCGEGGEYETFTLDCPLFKKKIIIDESKVVIHSDDAFAPVGFLQFKKMHLEDKEQVSSAFLQDNRCVDDFGKLEIETGNLNGAEIPRALRKGLKVKIPVQSKGHEKGQMSYSKCGDYIWVTGIYGHCTVEGKTLSIEDITRSVLQSLSETLSNLKASLKDGLIIHVFVKNMDDFVRVNSVYRTFITVNPPARACIQLNLPDDIAMQVDCLVYSPSNREASSREAMHVQSISHWAPANIGPYSQATKIKDTLFVSGSIGLLPATMTIVSGGISKEAPLSLQHVGRVITAMSPGESLRSIIHGFCFVTSAAYVSIAKNVWCQAPKVKTTENGERDLESHEGLISYIIVPALPKGALVEWHVVAQENHIQHTYNFTCTSREIFSVGVHSFAVEGNCNNSLVVNLEVGQRVSESLNCENRESESSECNLEEVMETLISELQCCTSQHSMDITDVIYMRIFYVKDVLDHWRAQDFIHVCLEKVTTSPPALSLTPVDGLEKENTFMLVSCLLQRTKEEIQE